MIHSFSCKNFYSFIEPTEVSFVVNDKAPKNNGYADAPSGTRLSKFETIIGANASGKTNLLKVLPFLKWLTVDSFAVDPSAQIPVKPYVFDGNKKPTELSVVFEVDKNIYTHTFVLDESRIYLEELKQKNKTKQKTTNKLIFSRKWDKEANRYTFEGKNFNLPKGFENLLRSNASVIGIGMRLNHRESQEIAKFWEGVETNVMEAGWIGDQLVPHAPMQLPEALFFYSQNQALKEEAEKLLSRFDIGLDAFNIVAKEQNANGFSLDVKVAHLVGGKKRFLPVQYESSGTKQLFILLKTILQVLAQGGVAILDELDVNLHPDMVIALFDLFVQPETNPHDAQIIFSTHSHRILSKLDKYQIILTEKNKKCGSESWRLDEMDNVRADDNYYAKYIAGAYGAIPKI